MKKETSRQDNTTRKRVIIPTGFFHVEGTVDNGYVSQNKMGDQFVLVPGGITADGVHMDDFWFSRFEISKSVDGAPRSIIGKDPWNFVNYDEAEEAAKSMGGMLISIKEYIRICMWLMRSDVVSSNELFYDGRFNGNYARDAKLAKTGSNPNWQHNHIFDFFGNGYTWTTEKSELYEHYRRVRGGHYVGLADECSYPPINWSDLNPEKGYEMVTFRVVLHVSEETEDED